ncbi:MAG: tripartite tricarboxylate transporter substrate binding protein [Desulfuromonadales bacterium]|nr:tripartite tricarboxylate transporter substrate binding protein [Desulfuromonadales bacterium]MBN2792030.1 tripartite tricarboxylate transporter substrate binding protein [Desulfuromonadales bacterium]
MKNTFKLLVLSLSLIFLMSSLACAAYPERPIKILIPYGAGGTTDIGVRMLASIVEKDLGQPIVVENKPGGSGTIALAAGAKAAADGYTLTAVTSSPMFITPHLRNVSYNPIEDFTAIMNYSGPYHGITVPASSDWKSFEDMVKYGKANPNKGTYGTAGTFGGAHISMLYVEKLTGSTFTHLPFKGSAAATAAILGGHVNFGIVPQYADHVEAGNVRVLAVLDGTRDPDFPNVPTLRDLGYDWEFASVVGLVAPAGTDSSIISKLEKAFIAAANTAEFKEFMKKANLPIRIMNSEEFSGVLKKNYLGYQGAIKELNLTK